MCTPETPPAFMLLSLPPAKGPGLSPVHLGRQTLGALAVSMGSLLWGCSIGWSAVSIPQLREAPSSNQSLILTTPLFTLSPLSLTLVEEASVSWVGSRGDTGQPRHWIPGRLSGQTAPDACALYPCQHWLADNCLLAQSARPLLRSRGDRVLLCSLWPGGARLYRGDRHYPGAGRPVLPGEHLGQRRPALHHGHRVGAAGNLWTPRALPSSLASPGSLPSFASPGPSQASSSSSSSQTPPRTWPGREVLKQRLLLSGTTAGCQRLGRRRRMEPGTATA